MSLSSLLFCVTALLLIIVVSSQAEISLKLTKVWGPGLVPDIITLPARYFFIQTFSEDSTIIPTDLDSIFNVTISGISTKERPCRIWTNILNRKDGSYIVRYKVYDTCDDLKIVIKHKENHVAESPYFVNGRVYPDDCDCPNGSLEYLLESWNCGPVPKQIKNDLGQFNEIDWDLFRMKVVQKFDQPHSISLCHYVIKENKVYRRCYGKYVGFKMFMDSILLSLTRKVKMPDVEFFVNLGDWPLVKEGMKKFPILSWCGSTDSFDVIMPTYDITESTLENMGRVMLDMLSVQGNVKGTWQNRMPKGFWRGRDSNQHRLDLIDISRKYPDLFNVSLTNFFFFRDKQEEYGPKSDHISFFNFFDYKYQLALDGTVAAYRFPYLLAGGSLVIKQDSKYYEHFYNDLVPNVHYIPMERDLSDLVEKLRWAIENDGAAQRVALAGQKFANDNLLPQNIFCYHAHLFRNLHRKITSRVEVLEGMELVPQVKQNAACECMKLGAVKDEL